LRSQKPTANLPALKHERPDTSLTLQSGDLVDTFGFLTLLPSKSSTQSRRAEASDTFVENERPEARSLKLIA